MEGPYFSDVRVFMMLASPRNKLQVRLPRSVRGGVRKLYLKIGKSQGGTPPPVSAHVHCISGRYISKTFSPRVDP